ncbi:MAG: HAMP domain-containing histidine kinase [Deltaproteobacteria bacterium]|nr:HAMP domain-containing histidine kinase [Deltaproteobacteria bacterium]
MRLRHRLALVFATATSLTVASAFGLTFAFFRSAQQRQLDYSLITRAELEAEETLRLGGHRLHIEQEPTGVGTELEGLVKYGAMYSESGEVLDTTPTFGGAPPPLASFGFLPDSPTPLRSFDFPYRGEPLRGVIVRVGPPSEHGPVLLLAASRGELDTDTRQMLEVMAAVLAAAAALALLIGHWLGVRMSRGIEGVASVARRVSEGELGARVATQSVGSDYEVNTLAIVLNQMIDRMGELLTAERRFVSHAAHELRSPLTALRGELELALRRPRSVEDYKKAIQESLESTERLVVLAEDLLALARVGTHGINDEHAPATLLEIAEDAVRASLARAEAARAVEVDIAPDLVVEGRRADLARMVRNLIDNAVAHAPEGSVVRVSGRPTNPGSGLIAVEVEDSGPGVPEAMQDRIFEPFFRGDAERERSGAGLGLAIAREIARAFGGDLQLDSRAARTRFVATLRQGQSIQRSE